MESRRSVTRVHICPFGAQAPYCKPFELFNQLILTRLRHQDVSADSSSNSGHSQRLATAKSSSSAGTGGGQHTSEGLSDQNEIVRLILYLFRLDRGIGLRKAVPSSSRSASVDTAFTGLDASNLKAGQYDPENIEHMVSLIVGLLKDPNPRSIKQAALRVLVETDGEDDFDNLDPSVHFDPRPATLAWK
jgi:hypothetical protein